jgi:hypothetical protein
MVLFIHSLEQTRGTACCFPSSATLEQQLQLHCVVLFADQQLEHALQRSLSCPLEYIKRKLTLARSASGATSGYSSAADPVCRSLGGLDQDLVHLTT